MFGNEEGVAAEVQLAATQMRHLGVELQVLAEMQARLPQRERLLQPVHRRVARQEVVVRVAV